MKFWILIIVGLVMACWSQANNHLYLASFNFIAIVLLIVQRARDRRWDQRIELRFYERELRRTNCMIGHLRSMPDRDWADNIALIGTKKEQTRIADNIGRLRYDIFGEVDGVNYTLEMEL